MVLERLSWRMTCPNHMSFILLTVARRGSCGPIRKLILLLTQSLGKGLVLIKFRVPYNQYCTRGYSVFSESSAVID